MRCMNTQPQVEREAATTGPPARDNQQTTPERTADDHLIRGYN